MCFISCKIRFTCWFCDKVSLLSIAWLLFMTFFQRWSIRVFHQREIQTFPQQIIQTQICTKKKTHDLIDFPKSSSVNVLFFKNHKWKSLSHFWRCNVSTHSYNNIKTSVLFINSSHLHQSRKKNLRIWNSCNLFKFKHRYHKKIGLKWTFEQLLSA